MIPIRLAAAAAFLTLAPVAALAQQSPEAAANNAVNAAAGQQAAANATSQAEYDADMAAYRATMRARHHAMTADNGVYVERERAYAAAMAEWRHNVWLCDHGNDRACDKPTPDPAAFM